MFNYNAKYLHKFAECIINTPEMYIISNEIAMTNKWAKPKKRKIVINENFIYGIKIGKCF